MRTQDSVLVVATSWPSDADFCENDPTDVFSDQADVSMLLPHDTYVPDAAVLLVVAPGDPVTGYNAEVEIQEHKGEIHTTLRMRPGREEALGQCMARAMEFLAKNAHPHDREDLGVKIMPVAGLPATSWSGPNCYAGRIKEVQRNGRTIVWVSSQGHEDTYTLRADGEYRRKGNHSGSLCLGDNRKTDLCREQ